jgi:CRP/FNR family transcriptional regulator, cyclic AMP receptor protein
MTPAVTAVALIKLASAEARCPSHKGNLRLFHSGGYSQILAMNPAELFRRDDDPVRLAPGQTLFREGDTGDCMYVLLEGLADVFVGEILVESATPGALLGEMALVDSSPRTATVVATMPARLARIDERRFHFLVQRTRYFATHMMKVLAERCVI